MMMPRAPMLALSRAAPGPTGLRGGHRPGLADWLWRDRKRSPLRCAKATQTAGCMVDGHQRREHAGPAGQPRQRRVAKLLGHQLSLPGLNHITLNRTPEAMRLLFLDNYWRSVLLVAPVFEEARSYLHPSLGCANSAGLKLRRRWLGRHRPESCMGSHAFLNDCNARRPHFAVGYKFSASPSWREQLRAIAQVENAPIPGGTSPPVNNSEGTAAGPALYRTTTPALFQMGIKWTLHLSAAGSCRSVTARARHWRTR